MFLVQKLVAYVSSGKTAWYAIIKQHLSSFWNTRFEINSKPDCFWEFATGDYKFCFYSYLKMPIVIVPEAVRTGLIRYNFHKHSWYNPWITWVSFKVINYCWTIRNWTKLTNTSATYVYLLLDPMSMTWMCGILKTMWYSCPKAKANIYALVFCSWNGWIKHEFLRHPCVK